jgi:ParB/RepB/Spo0J family partition protein
MSPTAAPPEPSIVTGYREVETRLLRPSPLNPRRHVGPVDDLAASIREKGILEPLLGRPHAGGIEIVAGERRWRAAKAAGLDIVPVIVRELTDAQVLEIAIVENNQRADVHPLDEADGFQRLQQLEKTYTPETIAAKIGRPAAYVKNRLRLLSLIGDARKAFNEDQLTLGHAQLLAKLTPEMQGKALKSVCFDTEFDYETGKGERILGPARLRNLQDFINQHVRLDIAAPDVQDEFPELAADVAEAQAAGAKVLMLSDQYGSGRAPKPGDPLNREDFTEVKKGAKGAVLGVFVQGRRRGKTTWVTLVERRATPAPSSTSGKAATPAKSAKQQEAERKARDAEAKRQAEAKAQREREAAVTVRAAMALAKATTPATLVTATALRELCGALSGADAFDQEILDQVARAIGVPASAFGYSDGSRAKLTAPALAKVAAVLVVGARSFGGDSGGQVAFRAFGIDVKAIDKAVAKEQAADAKRASAAPASGSAAKKTNAAKKAGKKR